MSTIANGILPTEQEQAMELTTSWKEEGIQLGIQQGLKQGFHQGEYHALNAC
jgi:flagellar biosynthesis/type III secretory pathway protein FliH